MSVLPEKNDAGVPEPRWPALVAIFAMALLYSALPASISVGPSWLLVVVVTVLEIPALFFHWRGRVRMNRVLGFAATAVMTGFLGWSLVLLVIALPDKKEPALGLLQSGAALWVSNVLVFSLWYWRLDAGGPTARERAASHTEGAFLFPQMMLKERRGRWSPAFIDYLFLAFNTSTALSPTDAPILSRWAKVLVMVQAMISLTVIVILAGRAVNIM